MSATGHTSMLPCPFCGAVPELEKWHGARYRVGCNNELCPSNPCVGSFTKKGAAQLWNTRHRPDETVTP